MKHDSPNRGTWPGGFYVDPPPEIHMLTAHHGLVIGAGPLIHRVRPGESTFSSRELPFAGPIRAVAAEPGRSRRYAVASDSRIAIFDDKDPKGFISRAVGPDEPKPSCLAWGLVEGKRVLHVLAGERVQRDDATELPFDPVLAIANDESGRFAVAVSKHGPDAVDEEAADLEAGVYVSDDGSSWKWRLMPELEASIGADAYHLAIRGDVAAVAIQCGVDDLSGLWVSRGIDDPFIRCSSAEFIRAVALDESGAVFAAIGEEHAETVVRFDAKGDSTCIIDLGGANGPPPITALAWDATRRTLWAASPTGGMIFAREPGAADVTLS